MPAVTGAQLLRVLRKLGFVVVRVVGSHHVVRHADGRRTSLPIHGRTTIKPGTLAAILRDVDISAEQLRTWL
jgi:predicted RNA binding protein YcfA (HicA-like mRNA interferase family)